MPTNKTASGGFSAAERAAMKERAAELRAGKFNLRYSTLEFQDPAHLDDGDIWPVGFAITRWTPAVEQKVAALIKKAAS